MCLRRRLASAILELVKALRDFDESGTWIFHHLAQLFDNMIGSAFLHKKALQPFRRDIGDSGFGVKAVASSVERGIAEVCGKDLDRLSRYIGYSDIARLLPHVLQERDSN